MTDIVKYPPLYKRDNNGNARIWWMEIMGSAHRSVAGIVDGQLVTSEWNEVTPTNVGKKNERLGPAQAVFEVESHYTKRLDRSYWERLEDIDRIRNIDPMLAKEYEKDGVVIDLAKRWKLRANDVVAVQPKLDGIRCIANKNGLWTRTGKPITAVPHIFNGLKPLFDKHPSAILDGELYNHELKEDFEKIVSFVRKAKPTKEGLAACAEVIEYHVYDICDAFEDEPQTFEERSKWLQDNWDLISSSDSNAMRLVKTLKLPWQRDKLQPTYDELFGEQGYEGVMLRKLDSLYEQKRSYNLLKWKSFIEEEFEVVDIIEGSGNWAGAAKTVRVKLPNGSFAEPTLTGSYDKNVKLLENKEQYFGKMATVKFQNWTADGSIRCCNVKALHLEDRI